MSNLKKGFTSNFNITSVWYQHESHVVKINIHQEQTPVVFFVQSFKIRYANYGMYS